MTRWTTPLAPCLAAAFGLLTLSLPAPAQGVITVERQTGPNPVLPEPQLGLFPTMKLSEVVGWKEGETPSVPQGYEIAALATGLENPRELYVLPNGDILVVEARAPKGKPISRRTGNTVWRVTATASVNAPR